LDCNGERQTRVSSLFAAAYSPTASETNIRTTTATFSTDLSATGIHNTIVCSNDDTAAYTHTNS
jgi:hypothetical protein